MIPAATGSGLTAANIPPMAGHGTPAVLALRRSGVSYVLHEYDVTRPADRRSASYGEDAAAALGVDTHRVFKTLVVAVDGGALCVAVIPVGKNLDLKALAAALGAKRAVLAEPALAERLTGYVRGGISPLGQRRALPTVVDRGACGRQSVFVSAGRRGLELELEPADLVSTCDAIVADIAT